MRHLQTLRARRERVSQPQSDEEKIEFWPPREVCVTYVLLRRTREAREFCAHNATISIYILVAAGDAQRGAVVAPSGFAC